MNNTLSNLDLERKRLRAWRNQLSSNSQKKYSLEMSEQLCELNAFNNAHTIGAYIAQDGEIDPQYIINIAWRLGKQVYLPVMSERKQYHLDFYAHNKHSKLTTNNYAISEPATTSKPIMPWNLDLVLLPLVAFDENCNRIGRGAGFYDRCFAFVNELPNQPRPTLIGLAYPEQKIATLKTELWDVPMDFIVTSTEIIVREN